MREASFLEAQPSTRTKEASCAEGAPFRMKKDSKDYTSGPLVTPLAFVEPEFDDGEVVGDHRLNYRLQRVVDLALGPAAFCVCLPTRKAWDQRSSPRPSPPTSQ